MPEQLSFKICQLACLYKLQDHWTIQTRINQFLIFDTVIDNQSHMATMIKSQIF